MAANTDDDVGSETNSMLKAFCHKTRVSLIYGKCLGAKSMLQAPRHLTKLRLFTDKQRCSEATEDMYCFMKKKQQKICTVS